MTDTADLTLCWTVLGAGWARLVWSIDDAVVEVHASYLSDGFVAVIGAALDVAIGSRATYAVLEGEPGGHRLFFNAVGDDVFVQIVVFHDVLHGPATWWNDARPVWHGRVSRSRLLAAMLRMAREVLDRHGEAAYLKEWGFPFPTSLVAELARAVHASSVPADTATKPGLS